jgi:CheY-like chemotaxis protein
MTRILVVDDDPDWQQTLEGLLVDEGYQVTTAGDEAKALAAAVQTSFDLAIVDVRLHGDDVDDDSGLSLALALKAFIPKMKVILLTGLEVRAEHVVRSIRFLGVEDFVEKSNDLIALVKQVLSRPSFEHGLNRLSLSLDLGQPTVVRAHGAHVCARRTNRVFQLSIPRYNRLAQEAADASNPRFNAHDIGKNLYQDLFENCPEALSSLRRPESKAGRCACRLMAQGSLSGPLLNSSSWMSRPTI